MGCEGGLIRHVNATRLITQVTGDYEGDTNSTDTFPSSPSTPSHTNTLLLLLLPPPDTDTLILFTHPLPQHTLPTHTIISLPISLSRSPSLSPPHYRPPLLLPLLPDHRDKRTKNLTRRMKNTGRKCGSRVKVTRRLTGRSR